MIEYMLPSLSLLSWSVYIHIMNIFQTTLNCYLIFYLFKYCLNQVCLLQKRGICGMGSIAEISLSITLYCLYMRFLQPRVTMVGNTRVIIMFIIVFYLHFFFELIFVVCATFCCCRPYRLFFLCSLFVLTLNFTFDERVSLSFSLIYAHYDLIT